MATATRDFVQLDRDLFGRSLGEVVASLVRQRYPSVKALARAWKIEVSTADNVWRGHASTRSITAAIAAEGWGFLDALGSTVTGETYDQYQERIITQRIREAEDARERLVSLRSRREALEQRAAGIADLHLGARNEHRG